MYICSLAVTDLLLALIVVPSYVLSTSIFDHPEGVLGDIMCKTITGDFLTSYFSDVSQYGLVLIALERLRAVQKFPEPIFNSSTEKRRIWLSIVISWIIPLIVDSSLAVFVRYRRERPVIGYHCIFLWGRKPTSKAKIYGTAILIFDLIPVGIFICSFCYISNSLMEQEKRVSEGIRGDTFNDGYRYYRCWQMVKQRQKTVKVLMITSAVYVVCWIPNKIMFFMVTYMGQKEEYSKLTWNSPLYQIGILLGVTGSCINPYLYAWQSKEFRKHSKRALKGFLPKCLDDDFKYRHIKSKNQRKETSIGSASEATEKVETERQSYSTTRTVGSDSEPSGTDSRLTEPSRVDSHTPILNVASQVKYVTGSNIPATYETIL